MIKKIILFFLVFTVCFAIIRNAHILTLDILLGDISSIPWLYSVIGIVFSITSGFIIQTQWNTWDSLLTSVREEVNSLRQIIIFSKHLPNSTSQKIIKAVEQYLESVVTNWKNSESKKKSEEVSESLSQLQEGMYEIFSKQKDLTQIAYSLFSNILIHRENRIHYSTRQLPKTLKLLIQLSTFMIISLSFLIGVKNMWLDYIFTGSIAFLSFVMYEVIIDLERPLHPGSWHVTSNEYKQLLKEIKNL
ncbi:MAG: DUF4239 domain-containing protein [Patescibacteria group bacterium]|nr:DUF4239 domain-containing protein [Patescibacteria group bacterium]